MSEHHTMPPLQRGHMTPRPWLGVTGRLRRAVKPRPYCAPMAPPPWPVLRGLPWQRAAGRRRGVLMALVLALATAAFALQWDATPADARDTLWWAQAALSTLLFAWVGIGLGTALMGAWVAWRGDAHGLAPLAPGKGIDAAARTAIIMPICNEDVPSVFAALEATCESLAASGALPLFDVFVLSDTGNAALRAAELRAVQRLRERLGDDATATPRIHYRWRRVRTKRKAGNVADFCRRWGPAYRYMVVLDADSTMRGDTLIELVRLMEAHPRAGIIQTLPQAAGSVTFHARVQQFSSHVIGRLFALGMAYWQLGESHYWGHNAILRVEPFMRECALAKLPGRGGLSGEILSHDFVEAALMRRAGYEVWLAPHLDGSWEQLPSNLVEELQRDRRWCQGNLQNARLVAEPGLASAHRTMLAVGAFSYFVAPLWLCFVALGSLGLAGASWALSICTMAMLIAPRLLGVGLVVARGETRAHGGLGRLGRSAVLELVVSALLAPVRMLAHAGFVLGALTGLRLEWKSPARDASALAWREALSRVVNLVLPAFVLALLMSQGQAVADWRAAPWLGPLLLAVPLVVWGADPRRGQRWRKLMALPNDQHLPRTLARADERSAFADLAPPAPPPATALQRLRTRSVSALCWSFVIAATVVMLPRQAFGPGLPLGWPMSFIQETRHHAESAPEPTTLQETAPRRRVLRAYKPARMIDDAVRQRAADYVREMKNSDI